MQIRLAEAKRFLKQFDFQALFVGELGWDYSKVRPIELDVERTKLTFSAVAEKRGLVILKCVTDDGSIPSRAVRSKAETKMSKIVHEHIIIFVDNENNNQVWQWVKRVPGMATAIREHHFHISQDGEGILQRLSALAFSLEEEEALSIARVAEKARAAFDADRITKNFYERFEKEHKGFLKFIDGISNIVDREWYASLMLNRMMFVYFIQKKGFLNGDRQYLQNKLRQNETVQGKNKFLSFYRYFLIRLFHEGLGCPPNKRREDLDFILGKVPYFNGGLFQIHEIESQYTGIDIEDEAFLKLFKFFEEYTWHIDDRPLRADNEINPDVLGYIFEKYINQKQTGAYYTKDDVTGYISNATIVPYIFSKLEADCPSSFVGENSIWRSLAENPARYTSSYLKKGVGSEIPKNIFKGLTGEKLNSKLDEIAEADFGAPSETWRDVIQRRKHYSETVFQLENDEMNASRLLPLRIDGLQLLIDAINSSTDGTFLECCWKNLCNITILDPTCGSGAFLFSALNVLEPLYATCLDAIDGLLHNREGAGACTEEQRAFFKKLIADTVRHPNRRYFVLKSAILNNIFGVDLMKEAVEICKLRLFLKMVSTLHKVEDIEPLPDIDFNIRSGNTLVGFVSGNDLIQKYEVDSGGQRRLISAKQKAKIAKVVEDAEVADRAFKMFRKMQTEFGVSSENFLNEKLDLRSGLERVRQELDKILAEIYGIDPSKEKKYEEWRSKHLPFHWFTEYFGIMAEGGFSVVIGNPPWKEYSAVKKDYTVRGLNTEKCGNLHGMCTERSLSLAQPNSYISFIVQLPLANSSRMRLVRSALREMCSELFVATFDDRPGRLFEGLEHCRSTIFIAKKKSDLSSLGSVYATRYHRWRSKSRAYLFDSIEFAEVSGASLFPDQFPKYSNVIHQQTMSKLAAHGSRSLGTFLLPRPTRNFVFYQEATQYWIKASVGLPYYSKNGKKGAPAHGRYLYCENLKMSSSVCAIMNSSIFYLYFITYSDCFHLSDTLVSLFPADESLLSDESLSLLGQKLMLELTKNSVKKTINTKSGDKITYGESYGALSKGTINEIDDYLAKYFGFTDEELDFIKSYDVKFRMSLDQ